MINNELRVNVGGDIIALKLTQEAHQDVPIGAEYQWQASAMGSDGNEYIVTWVELDGHDGDDCGEACDWDNYAVISI